MAEKKSEHKRLKNQYKHYDMVLKERMAKEIGAFLANLLDKGYMNRSAIKSDFGIDYKTTADLTLGAPSCTFGTMRKFAYVIAYYLEVARIKSEDIKYILDKEEQLAEVHRLTEDYKSIYGIEATCVLELTRKNIDLRKVVKT